jgi:hypothetical protein
VYIHFHLNLIPKEHNIEHTSTCLKKKGTKSEACFVGLKNWVKKYAILIFAVQRDVPGVPSESVPPQYSNMFFYGPKRSHDFGYDDAANYEEYCLCW